MKNLRHPSGLNGKFIIKQFQQGQFVFHVCCDNPEAPSFAPSPFLLNVYIYKASRPSNNDSDFLKDITISSWKEYFSRHFG